MDTPLTQAEFRNLLLPPRSASAIAVAVSGGADSLALTVVLGEYCLREGISLTALTVDHGLRGDSAQEARTVGSWLEKRGIAHVILKWQGDKPQSNIQDQARLARYRLMGEWCQENDIARLFLGHHQGDQAETFLIRLFRGSGIDGLSAMKIRSDFPVPLSGRGDITLHRPLLAVPKARLEATLRHMNQPWIEDPSNQNETYTRIKVRNLLKQNDIEGLNAERMAQTAARMGRVQSLLLSLTGDLTRQSVIYFPQAYAEVELLPLLSAHEEIALRCLASLVRRIGGGKYTPRLMRLEALYDRLKTTGFSGQTLGGCLISPLGDNRVMISREVSAIDAIIDLEADREILWDGRFFVENRAIKGILQKLGSISWRAVCGENPELKKLKLHKAVRDSLPCIISDSGKVALPDFMPGFEKTGFKATFK
ncbi:MAG: tRNA lysidine(34) synthetase TilS [Alphaproteobacteria bacterium]|nr:MAG: tRNA lysidine(34) synthetase TilS [Alphaproteobacteria bacterium]